MNETAVLESPETAQIGSVLTFEQQINAAKDKDELSIIAEKLGLMVDGRMAVDKIRKNLLTSYKAQVKAANEVTKESAKKMTTKEDPIVTMKFTILDILNPDESPSFEFVNDCGRGVPKGGVIPKWSFMHGETYDVPYSIYEFLKELSIPRPKWVPDASAPNGLRCVTVQKKRFNCELIMSKEQVLKAQKVA